MTDRNCDTCKNYEAKDVTISMLGASASMIGTPKPVIRSFTQAEFDRAKADKETWKRVLFTANDGISWDDEEGNGGPIRGIATKHPDLYGLPCTDPFWTEHWNGEPCELPVWYGSRADAIGYRFEYTGEYRCACAHEWVHDSINSIWCLTSDITAIKYWILRAISKKQKSFEQQISDIYNKPKQVDPLSEFKNAVDNIERNKVTFKVGDWFIDSAGLPRQVTETNLVYVKRHADKLRRPSRADFIVKINGHEWLAVENNNGSLCLYLDGDAECYYSKNDPLFNTFINLPVCPAGLK